MSQNIFSPNNPQWRDYLNNLYTEVKATNPEITLETLYPVAQQLFLQHIQNKEPQIKHTSIPQHRNHRQLQNSDVNFYNLIANPKRLKPKIR